MTRTLVLVLFLSGSAPLLAQPDPGKYSPEKYRVKQSRGHLVAMRDGVRLSVDIYQPDVRMRVPAILAMTPYNNNSSGWVQRANWFAKRGYAVVIADTRGRYDSEGEWDPFGAKHKTDGYDLVEWIAKETWCLGTVGMMGTSYQGWTQWWTASQGPPSLKVIVPEVAPPDALHNAPYQQGILVSWMMDWAAMMSGRTMQTVSEGAYGGFATTRVQDFMKTPYLTLNERRGAIDSPWFAKWIKQNLAIDEYWKGIAYQTKESYERAGVPTLSVSGWFDANYPGSPMNYQGMKKYGSTPAARRPSLVLGPWPHSFNRGRKLGKFDYGPQSVIDWDGYVCRWFDHYLQGIDNGVEKDPPVHVFVMGRNRWYAEKDWPLPQTKWTKYFLHSGGKANGLEGDGTLDTTPPEKEPADSYTYDPHKPTPSPFKGGHLEDGAVDSRPSAKRDDVLVYSTAPLEEGVELTGPIVAKLFAATSARDTDWMMRLIDVHPDGYAALLCDGVMRARHRDPEKSGAFNPNKLSTIEPDKVLEYTLEFWRGTSNLFAKGHRIRIEISSSYFPYYLRNLNTGADNIGLERKTAIARQQVHHSAQYPTHVVLPVIERSDK